jgi:hypothetical protein
MNIITNALGKVGSFFSGIGSTIEKDYKGATAVATNDINAVEKDVKIIVWLAIVLFIVYIFGGRR